jgi:phosphoglycerate dehydrogenase-like enzyme
MRIVLLGAPQAQAQRLADLLPFAHEFVAASNQQQAVDAVIALKFGRAEACRFLTPLLHLPGAGADAVEFEALQPGCSVCNVFEHEVPIAEFVFAAMLDHALGYGKMAREFSAERWSEIYHARRPHAEIFGKTLGLLGFGHIGKAVTQRARAFGMQVHAISHSGHAPGADWVGSSPQLHEMLAVADFIVIACPLTAETRGLIGADEIAAMKSSAILINIGRAQIIDEEPLFRALQSGRLAGATLDVWYDYPAAGDLQDRPSRFPFERLPNVHCTPHSCAWTEGLFQRRYAVIADNLARLRRGEPLRNVIYTAPRPNIAIAAVDGGVTPS